MMIIISYIIHHFPSFFLICTFFHPYFPISDVHSAAGLSKLRIFIYMETELFYEKFIFGDIFWLNFMP